MRILVALLAVTVSLSFGQTVCVRTNLGDIDVKLLPESAPLTVQNFLKYVNRGSYNTSFIHRSVVSPIPFVIVGGGFQWVNNQPREITSDGPIRNEFRVSNLRGTIAMSKLGTDPNSATTQWFFNLADNATSLNNQNGGFTVFGRVANDASLAVMDAIARVPVYNAGSPFDSIPLQNYRTGSVTSSNLVMVNAIVPGGGPDLIGTFNAGIATVDVNGNASWDGMTLDRSGSFGQAGDKPFAGDWDGSGVVRLGVFRNGVWFFDWNNNLQWDGEFVDRIGHFGQAGDVPFVGDWDGTGRTRIGVFRGGAIFLDLNGNLEWDIEDRTGHFGSAGDIPVVGRWNGGLVDVIAVYRGGSIFVDRNANLAWDGPSVDGAGNFGLPGDIPFSGDWVGAGTQRLGVFRDGSFYLDLNGNLNWDSSDVGGSFGQIGDIPIVGDWDRRTFHALGSSEMGTCT